MNTRRKLFLVLSTGMLYAACPALAQQPVKVRRIGFLAAGPRPTPSNPNVDYDAFLQGMRELGYVEGKNLVIEWRFAENQYERLPALAADLVNSGVDVIVTNNTPATKAAQRATRTTPIVMGTVGDPVGSGFAATLARPGGNITGLSLATTDTSAKWLELAKITVPTLSRVAVLAHPSQPIAPVHLKNIQAAAKTLGLAVFPVYAGTPDEIERAFPTMARELAEAVIILPNTLVQTQRRQIAQLALKHRLPSIMTTRAHAEAGALVSYGQNYADFYRRAATYVDKILKGAKPSELPIEQPNVFELIVNRKTAKALGLTIPQELLLRADEVIE